jgi:hypothetical protein
MGSNLRPPEVANGIPHWWRCESLPPAVAAGQGPHIRPPPLAVPARAGNRAPGRRSAAGHATCLRVAGGHPVSKASHSLWNDRGALLLRHQRPGGPAEEVYVARKLSIGRAVDNGIVIDHPDVDRHHAEVQRDASGQYVLRCLSAGAAIEVDGRPQHEVPLAAGVRFQIADTRFECREAPTPASSPPREATVLLAACCPHCGGQQFPPSSDEPQPCPTCGQPVLVLESRGGRVAMLPAAQHGIQIERRAASGGMAWVLQGRRGEQLLAVKVLYPELAADPKQQARFQRECDVLQGVVHPHVLRVVDSGSFGELPYLAAPWQPGGTLADVIQRHRRQQSQCDFDLAVRWLSEAAAGLQALHQQGVVHRDVKPSNLLLGGQDGPVLVADLGIARPADGNTSLTTTGAVAGTYHYIAPEVWQALGDVDHRADQYSLGVVFYELLTGQRPLRGSKPASQCNATVPARFDEVLERLMAFYPSQRYASLEGLGDALDAYRRPDCECWWRPGWLGGDRAGGGEPFAPHVARSDADRHGGVPRRPAPGSANTHCRAAPRAALHVAGGTAAGCFLAGGAKRAPRPARRGPD